jgi:DNA-binding transcriptional LysR family regulator
MELRHLRSFCAVADLLSFIQASRRLHLSQPALSAQIQALESDLGVQLLERTRRTVKLTPAGLVFRQEAQNILQSVEAARLRIHQIASGEAGHLRIGFVASAALEIVPTIVLAFRRNHPNVSLDLLNIRTTDQLSLLEQDKLDVGFLRLPVSSPHLTITPLHKEPFTLVLPRGHRLARKKNFSLRELEREPFVAYGRQWAPGFYDRWVRIFVSAGFSPTVIQEAGEMATVLALVSAGAGVAVVPQGIVARRPPTLVTKPLPSNAPQSEIGIAIRRNQHSPLIENFVQLARSFSKGT